MNTTHTPLPWDYDHEFGHHKEQKSCVLHDPGLGNLLQVATLEGTEAKPNAELIVQAVNYHDRLVEALKLAQSHLTLFTGNGGWDDQDERALRQIGTLLAELEAGK